MRLIVLLILIGLGSVPAAHTVAGPEAGDTDLRVALTFDDLPFIPRGDCSADEIVAVNRRLLETLERENIPAAGLVVGGRQCGDDEATARSVLQLWLEHGHDLGNHTHSHRDLNAVSLDWYLEDIAATQTLLDRIDEGQKERRWFRAPLLHMGDTTEKREGLRAFLERNDYVVAPVTVDNQEWVFAAVYERALAAGDDALANRVVDAYLEHLDTSFAYYEDLSGQLFDRQIPQVLLLHANRINADHLNDVIEMLRNRGYRFVSLEAAVADPAYEHEDRYVGPRGLSWLQRWALSAGIEPAAEPREPAWIAELMR